MLIRNSYKGCERLYWELEDFDQEAPAATFCYQGQTYHLEFDGCVDDLIWNNLKNPRCSAVDIAELYEAVPLVETAGAMLQEGFKVDLRLSSGQKWVAKQRTSGGRVSIVLRSAFGQSATLTTDEDNRVNRMTLRTDGRGITHEIQARVGSLGYLEPVSEAVTVYR